MGTLSVSVASTLSSREEREGGAPYEMVLSEASEDSEEFRGYSLPVFFTLLPRTENGQIAGGLKDS